MDLLLSFSTSSSKLQYSTTWTYHIAFQGLIFSLPSYFVFLRSIFIHAYSAISMGIVCLHVVICYSFPRLQLEQLERLLVASNVNGGPLPCVS